MAISQPFSAGARDSGLRGLRFVTLRPRFPAGRPATTGSSAAPRFSCEPVQFRRSRNRHDPRLLSEEPGERDLRRRRIFPCRERLQPLDEGEIGFSILFGEPRHDVSEIGGIERRRVVDLSREKTFPKRAEGHQTDAQLLEGRQHLALGFSPPQRVLALQRGDRLDRVGATNRLHAGLGEAEMLDLAFANQIADRARDVFDRHVRDRRDADRSRSIRSVLSRFKRCLSHLADVRRTAVEACLLAVLELEAELGRDHHPIAERAAAPHRPVLRS